MGDRGAALLETARVEVVEDADEFKTSDWNFIVSGGQMRRR
jgi:hypothetical protein